MSDEFCPRQIVFTIPGNPGVQVTATEDNGKIDFILDVQEGASTADLRALFFHFTESKLAGLTFTETGGTNYLTETKVLANKVIDLGDNANLNGGGRKPFDIGMEWGTPGTAKDDLYGPLTFTLSRAQNDLTLDDIGGRQFGATLGNIGGPGGVRNGASKITGDAPHAPDANDDSFNGFEDGAANANTPSKAPVAIKLDVLANDTDGDVGQVLSILNMFHDGPEHGTVTTDGEFIYYTPDLDWSGTDSFEYCMSDGAGGQDSAVCTVTVQAVADKPLVTYTVAPGVDANHVVLTVTGDQNDLDSSEFLDKLVAGLTPAGVTVTPAGSDPAGQVDHISQAFDLTVTPNQSYNFNLTFTATSQETSNGDTETGETIVAIVIEYKENSSTPTFFATDQSIWGPGDALSVHDDRFIGVNPPALDETGGSIIGYAAQASLKAGFQSTLHFEGGDIDAQLNYDLGVDTTFNKTTDTLQIHTSVTPTGGSFTTHGPEGSYKLDFIFEYQFHFAITYDIGVDSGDIYGINLGDSYSQNIINLDSATLSASTSFPPPFSGITASVQWPHITTTGGASPPPQGEVSGNGASNNFLQLDVDVDQVLSDIFLGGVNPFDIPFDVGIADGHIELVDLDVSGGINLLQRFAVQPTGMTGVMHFEDGSDQAFTFGTDIIIQNASAIDLNGNHDGHIDYFVTLDPVATLRNETDVGVNVGYSFDLLKVTGSYDIGVDSGSIDIGPLLHLDGTLPVGSLNIYDKTFPLDFASQQFSFFA